VNELFYSIQGEGFHAGKPAIFIRLAGCNLNCNWCDTNHSKVNLQIGADELVRLISQNYKSLNSFSGIVIITGGEPTLQRLQPLVDALHSMYRRQYVCIETNGTRLNSIPLDTDWITFSPKHGVEYPSGIRANEIKIVYDEKIDPNKWYNVNLFQHHFIQPCSQNFNNAIKFVMENPQWRLSVQLQKLINIS